MLPQEEEFKYLRVLFISEERMEWEIDRRIGAASAVMQQTFWWVEQTDTKHIKRLILNLLKVIKIHKKIKHKKTYTQFPLT